MTEDTLFVLFLASGLLNVILATFVISVLLDAGRVKKDAAVMARYIIQQWEGELNDADKS